MDHLFEPYVTSHDKGTGLGLAIVKKIVEEHSGTLTAENIAGGGARITIRFPIDENTLSAGEGTRGSARVDTLREKRA